MDETPTFQGRIVTAPDGRAVTPVVRGTSISVESILARLAESPDSGALLADLPELTLEDIKAALAYARAVLADARGREAARDRRFRRVLAIAERNPDGDGDAFLVELEREDAEQRARARA